MTDAQLLLASRSDPAAFAGLFDRHAPDLYRYLACRAGPDAAEDLLSETFLAAFERRLQFDPARGEPRGWLYGIASNLLRHHARGLSRRNSALIRLQSGAATAPDAADRVVEQLAAAQDTRFLAEDIARLAEGDREVLFLHAMTDLSYAEIAAALDIPAGTVRSRLHRARTQLRAARPLTRLTHMENPNV